jgi:hypothetical protein
MGVEMIRNFVYIFSRLEAVHKETNEDHLNSMQLGSNVYGTSKLEVFILFELFSF